MTLLQAPGTVASTPAFIAGGGFATRLHAAQTPPPAPKLPGGHQYTAVPLHFIPLQQLSIPGRIHKIGNLFGWFDPTCKNAEYELAKTREQQIADGYTREDLKRLVREHCQ